MPERNGLHIIAVVMEPYSFINAGTESCRLKHHNITATAIKNKAFIPQILYSCRYFKGTNLISLAPVDIKQISCIIVSKYFTLTRIKHAIHAVLQHFYINQL
ncbi:hypothetical protein D3C80_1772410 [compost metagenome]